MLPDSISSLMKIYSPYLGYSECLILFGAIGKFFFPIRECKMDVRKLFHCRHLGERGISQ